MWVSLKYVQVSSLMFWTTVKLLQEHETNICLGSTLWCLYKNINLHPRYFGINYTYYV